MDKLHDEWAYWFDDLNEKPNQFQSNLQMLEQFETIDKFWQVFNSLPKLQEIPENCSLILMKKNIKPIWEDCNNYYGQISKYKIKINQADTLWKEINIFMISLEHCDEYEDESINGILIKIKSQENIILEVWSKVKNVTDAFMQSFQTHSQNYNDFYIEKIRTYNSSDLIKNHKIKNNIKKHKKN